MKTLYIHGMGGQPRPEKLNLIHTQGFEVDALHLNYNHNSFTTLKKHIQEQKIQFLIGQSHGGFMAFWLAEELGLPCLLTNPALSLRAKKRVSPKVSQLACPLCLVALGEEDEAIDPQRTIKYLELDKREDKIIQYKLFAGEKHGLSPKVFTEVLIWAKEGLQMIKK